LSFCCKIVGPVTVSAIVSLLNQETVGAEAPTKLYITDLQMQVRLHLLGNPRYSNLYYL
jgi:hypothetical protein